MILPFWAFRPHFQPKNDKNWAISSKMAAQGPRKPKKIIRSGLTCKKGVGLDIPIDFPEKIHFSGLLGLQFGPKRAEI